MFEINNNRSTRSNKGIFYLNTVQTSWRPQLPLPKEIVDIDQEKESTKMDKSMKKDSNQKKWSFGRFFRKKKDMDTDSSSEDDRKAGFTPQKQRKKEKRRRSSKMGGVAFDHIVINSKENEIFLPLEDMETPDSMRSSGSLDRRTRSDRKLASNCHSSSDDEIKSHNSSLSKYRSDESIGSANVTNRKSRAARTERYYKRLSRDETGTSPTRQLPMAPQASRWKTQPIPSLNYIYANQQQHREPDVKSTHSGAGSHGNTIHPTNWGHSVRTKSTQYSPIHPDKRSFSYDNNIHFPNQIQSVEKNPPPPPPRDPQRRVHLSGRLEARPMSYAFDKCPPPASMTMNGRCVSDDKLWGPHGSIYQTIAVPQRPASTQPIPQPRRFISRQDQNPLSTLQDYKYVTDVVPRSRKPIHIVNQEVKKPQPLSATSTLQTQPIIRTSRSGLQSPMQAASHFWKKIEEKEKETTRRGSATREQAKTLPTQSGLTSGAGSSAVFRSQIRPQRGPLVLDNYKNPEVPRPPDPPATYCENSIVSGSLSIKPAKDKEKNLIEITSKLYEKKSGSMPDYYQSRQPAQVAQPKVICTSPLNKYDEYVNKRSSRCIINPKDIQMPVEKEKRPPPPPQRYQSKTQLDTDSRKSANLEEAINELEAIYNSLGLADENLLDRAERRDIPTPTCFSKYSEHYKKYGDTNDDLDEDHITGEPDVVLDDVVYRNLKRANQLPKTVESQPPFGIPIGPVPPSPNTDYLHVTPQKENKIRYAPQNYPDLVGDDLAVRSLRKEAPILDRTSFLYPTPNASKKKRAARSMSANIYNLIHRDAAKPSGGNLYDYFELDRSLEKAGSLTDIGKDTDDIPSALQLLRNIQKQEKSKEANTQKFSQHPTNGGAVFNLPSTLKNSPRSPPFIMQKTPVPMPRKSISPDPVQERSGMEEVLNQIAKEAKESSEKLSRELIELRKEVDLLSKSSREDDIFDMPKKGEMQKMDKDIEKASIAGKVCEDILLDVIPPEHESNLPIPLMPRRLDKEEKLISDINAVSEAAQVCEKILQNTVDLDSTTIPDIEELLNAKNKSKTGSASSIVSDPFAYKDSKQSDGPVTTVVASLIEKLEPQATNIGKIASRCMRQISELGDLKETSVLVDIDDEKIYDGPDYDNLNLDIGGRACKKAASDSNDYPLIQSDSIILGSEEEVVNKMLKGFKELPSDNRGKSAPSSDEIRTSDEIVREIELSSSDGLRSSSPTQSRHQSSSITSINPFSSSDYVKSPSSEMNLTTDPIKTISTSSYDVASSSVTPNITPSPLSTTPSPLIAITPLIGNDIIGGGSPSQYNSSEELAMIFGIDADQEINSNGSGNGDIEFGESMGIGSGSKSGYRSGFKRGTGTRMGTGVGTSTGYGIGIASEEATTTEPGMVAVVSMVGSTQYNPEQFYKFRKQQQHQQQLLNKSPRPHHQQRGHQQQQKQQQQQQHLRLVTPNTGKTLAVVDACDRVSNCSVPLNTEQNNQDSNNNNNNSSYNNNNNTSDGDCVDNNNNKKPASASPIMAILAANITNTIANISSASISLTKTTDTPTPNISITKNTPTATNQSTATTITATSKTERLTNIGDGIKDGGGMCYRYYYDLPPSQKFAAENLTYGKNVLTIASFNISSQDHSGDKLIPLRESDTACLDSRLDRLDSNACRLENENEACSNGSDSTCNEDGRRHEDINEDHCVNIDDVHSKLYKRGDRISPALCVYNDTKALASLDSLSSQDESNPDSGNVSLADFPVQQQQLQILNSRLELSLFLNTRFENNSNRYPFINQIDIQTSEVIVDRCDRSEGSDETDSSDLKTVCHVSNTLEPVSLENSECIGLDSLPSEVNDDSQDIEKIITAIDACIENQRSSEAESEVEVNLKEVTRALNDILSRNTINVDGRIVDDASNPINPSLDSSAQDLRNRSKSVESSLQSESACVPTTSSSLSSPSSRGTTTSALNAKLSALPLSLTQTTQGRQTLLRHIIFAYGYSLASNELFTIIAIIVAVITIFALLIL